MEQMHTLLKRQLRRYLDGGKSIPKEWQAFVEAVNSAYSEFDADRRMLERSLELTSQELLAANQKAEDRFQKAFHANPEPISIIAVTDRRYIDVNESFLRDTGYRREEVIGRTALELKFWTRPEEHAKFVDEVVNQGPVRDSEITFRTKSGKERLGRYSAEVIELGGQKCILAITKDVTEEKRLEEQLRQSQKMEAIGQLSGGIAHDFNNFLNVIIGYSELLLEELEGDQDLRMQAEQITKAARRAALLIRQLLAFSRRQVLETKVLDLNYVVGEMAKLLPPLVGEQIELHTRLDPVLGRVRADQAQIEQIIMNLAVNARDAMPDGGKLVMSTFNFPVDREYASSHPPMEPGDYVMLVINDTGTGMDEKTLKRIFEPFFTTKEQGKGTGLGLATVYGAVKQNNGYVWVDSALGQGTSFRVFFPLVEAHVEPAKAQGSAPALRQATETILLVEDEESLRGLTKRLLVDGGYTVLHAPNGADAIRIARNYHGTIHMLLTDVVMPGMNGRVVAEELRNIRPDTKVVFMSGYTGHDPRLLEFGAPLIAKPFTKDSLLRRLRETFDSTESDGSPTMKPKLSDVIA